MLSVIAHEIAETSTDQYSTTATNGGWFDAVGNEMSDKCATDFSPLYNYNGFADYIGYCSVKKENVVLNGNNYYLQTQWALAQSSDSTTQG